MEYAYTEVAAARLEPLSEMAQAIASADSVQLVFRAVFLFAARTTPARGIFVARYDAESGLRTCVYSADLIQRPDGSEVLEEAADLSVFPELTLNDGPQSQAIRSGRAVITPDLDAATAGIPMVHTGSDFDVHPPRASLAVPFGVEGRVMGAFEAQSPQLQAFQVAHLPGLQMAARLAAIAVQNLTLLQRERTQHEATLRALGLALEYRDYETKGHTDRVVAMSLAFAERLGLDSQSVQALRWGAYLHDIGKVAIPDRILLKPDRLTEEEFEAVRRHALIGVDMCRDIPFLLPGTREVVRSHHERFDGGGYPDRLQGSEIPLLARMFSLVDVYDALTSVRPYKPAWSHDEAVAELREQAGYQFDPELVEPFVTGVVAAV